MAGPGGGVNSGGFGGGIYEGSSGNNYFVPQLNFNSLIDLYVEIQNTMSNVWVSLHKPFYNFLEDLIIGDGTGFVSDLFENVFNALSYTGLDEFLNQFTTLSFIFGSGIVFLIGYNVLKWLKL